jgi:hypothetical protein
MRLEPAHSDPARPADGVARALAMGDLPMDPPTTDPLTTELQACEREARPSTEGRRATVASRVVPHWALEAAIPLAQPLRTVGLDQAPPHMQSLRMRSLPGRVTRRLTSPTEDLEVADTPWEALPRLAADTLGVDPPSAADARLEAATLEGEEPATLAASAADMAAAVVMAADKACY